MQTFSSPRVKSLPRPSAAWWLSGPLALLVASWVGFAPAAEAPVPGRYAVQFADGTQVTGKQITDWTSSTNEPQLDGKSLNQPQAWRWIANYAARPRPLPTAFVEMQFGDRLPGQAVQVAQIGGQTLWLVRPSIELRPPGWSRQQLVRIPTRYARRIVWLRTVEAYEPGLVIHRDGRTWRAKSIELGEQEVSLLGEQGIERVAYRDLAELHWPSSAPWDMYRDMLKQQSPQLETPFWHWTTSDGLRLTAARSTFAVAQVGQRWRSEDWVHGLKPIWSDQPLWVRFPTINWWQEFAPDRVPLTLLVPHPELGPAPTCHRNARDGLLQVGQDAASWGWGTRAPSRLVVDLPPRALEVSVGWGLDRISRGYGSAAGRIFLRRPAEDSAADNAAAPIEPLLDSGILQGTSEQPVRKRATLPPTAAAAQPSSVAAQPTAAAPAQSPRARLPQLVFEVDPADGATSVSATTTPTAPGPPLPAPGALGDYFDWLEPEIVLDPAGWRATAARP